MKLLIVIGIVCLIYVNLASSEANIDGTKPLEAEQNFLKLKRNFKNKATDRLLKLKDETEFAKLMADEEEGSGDDDYEDDEDYDEDEYDYDEDEYDYEEGSGDDDVLNFGEDDLLPISSKEVNVPLEADDNDKSDDFHFVEDKINHKKVSKDDFLYEYYNDLLYGNEDDEYLQELEQDLGKDFMNVDNTIVEEDVIVTETTENGNGIVIRPAYISLMLASALVSFALFTLMFILCRKSMLERQQKQKSVPFIVTSGSSSSRYSAKHSTPIVKNYQRVPTSTKEMMLKQQSNVELGITSDTQKPLLTWKKKKKIEELKLRQKKSIFLSCRQKSESELVCLFFPKYLIYKINLLFLLEKKVSPTYVPFEKVNQLKQKNLSF